MMTNNKIVIVILVLIVAGSALVGFLPKSPDVTSPTPPNNALFNPAFSLNYNLPSLLALKIWPTAFPTVPGAPAPTTVTPANPTPTTPPQPTVAPQPTTPPIQPTNTPVPTNPPQPPLTIGSVRPGATLIEMAQIAEKYTCTPAALLLAIKKEESGDGATHISVATNPTYVRYYNTFGWWTYADAGESYFALNYNTITGMAPPDSAPGVAGTRIAQPIGNTSAGSQWIMGMMQINQTEQNSVTTKFQQNFKGSNTPDRRIPFDALVLGGFLYKNLSSEPSACNLNWELKYIARLGCKFHGSCLYNYNGNTGDYCREICQYYGQYGGPGLNCANAVNTLKPGTCDIK